MYSDGKWSEILNLSFDFNTALMRTYYDLMTESRLENYNIDTSKNFIELILPILGFDGTEVSSHQQIEVPLS